MDEEVDEDGTFITVPRCARVAVVVACIILTTVKTKDCCLALSARKQQFVLSHRLVWPRRLHVDSRTPESAEDVCDDKSCATFER